MDSKTIISNIKSSDIIKKFIHHEFPQNNGTFYKSFEIKYDEETALRSEKEFLISKKDQKPYIKKSTKRVDLSAFVQISNRKYAGFYPLFGIEIKVTLADLKNDLKFYKYIKYYDYFLFAVPDFLIEEAKEYLSFFENVGLISVDKKTATLVKNPKINTELIHIHRVQVLENFILKSLK